MLRLCLIFILILPISCLGQNNLKAIINQAYEKGHFNGTVLYINGDENQKIYKGYANFQFEVQIDDRTRFPIASVTKLFTSIALIQLQEKGLIHFSDPIGKYLNNLSEEIESITIQELITHHSGLSNEPIQAVIQRYMIDEYIDQFVQLRPDDTISFKYNNVDFVLLSKIIEKVTNKTFPEAIEALILAPLKLNNTGFVQEDQIIKYLAYGYHNYTFGEGNKDEPLYNDNRYISNYAGAGAMYSTTEDLYHLLIALKDNKLISEESKNQWLLKPQNMSYIDWLHGIPTIGFYYDDQQEVYRRSGSIDGFNSVIVVDKKFNKILIILCNTDTADLDSLVNKIYFNQ